MSHPHLNVVRELPYHCYLGLETQDAEAGRSRVVMQVHAQNIASARVTKSPVENRP